MDVQYFIDKFEAIPEENWCVGTFVSGDKCCANGHLGVRKKGNHYFTSNGLVVEVNLTPEAIAFQKIMSRLKITSDGIPVLDGIHHSIGYSTIAGAINNGQADQYPGDSPKQMILSALRDIQKMEGEESTINIPLCSECGKPITECECEDEEEEYDEDWDAGATEEVGHVVLEVI